MRIISYNIHKGVGGQDRRYRPERIIEVLAQQTPDIICLQEVTEGVRKYGNHDQPQMLADHFSAQGATYQQNVRYSRGGYGNLILSRWPIEEQHHICLRLGRRKPRGAQLVRIATPEGPCYIVNWHLGLAERERQWQVEQFLTHDLAQQLAGVPLLITGDFNDWRNTLGRRRLATAGFHEITNPPRQFRSFPAYMALGSLDKAFVRGGLQVSSASIVRNELSRKASDHLPLEVNFHLSPSATLA